MQILCNSNNENILQCERIQTCLWQMYTLWICENEYRTSFQIFLSATCSKMNSHIEIQIFYVQQTCEAHLQVYWTCKICISVFFSVQHQRMALPLSVFLLIVMQPQKMWRIISIFLFKSFVEFFFHWLDASFFFFWIVCLLFLASTKRPFDLLSDQNIF